MSAESRKETIASSARAASLLALFAIVCAGLVALAHRTTAERIADNQQRFILRSLHEIIPPHAYDNELHRDIVALDAPELGNREGKSIVYRARKDGHATAAILSVTAPDGYSGAIHLLVGIYADGSVAGVRVTAHKETPGLGDGIEADRSGWIRDFNGKSLVAPPEADWAVRRDGGAFDQFTGATITPRAVVRAVRSALIYFREHRDELLAPAAPETG